MPDVESMRRSRTESAQRWQGLVRVEQRAQRRIYAVDPGPMSELDRWLAPYRRLWNARLDRLGAHLDDTDPQKGK